MGIFQLLLTLYSIWNKPKFSPTLLKQTFTGCTKMANQISNKNLAFNF